MTAETTSLPDAARVLSPQIRACRDEIERERQLPASLVGAIAGAGLFRMWVPRALGGGEVEPDTLIEVVEEVARADGATGWCVMIAAGTGLVGGLLREDAGRIVFGDPLVVTGGAIAPMGRAAVVEGGYRVSGRWPFGSGSPHCDWLVGNCVVFDSDAPRMIAQGVPETRVMLFRRGQFEIIDTWHTAGLRGTGSHDFTVHDLFVPAELSLSFAEPPVHPGPLYRFPIFGLLALSVAAVPLGIARGASDTLVELAGAKTPAIGRGVLAERPVVQVQVAQAEALLRSARALLYQTARDTWATITAGGALSLDQRRHRVGPGRRSDVPCRRRHVRLCHQSARTRLPRHPHRHPARPRRPEHLGDRRTGVPGTEGGHICAVMEAGGRESGAGGRRGHSDLIPVGRPRGSLGVAPRRPAEQLTHWNRFRNKRQRDSSLSAAIGACYVQIRSVIDECRRQEMSTPQSERRPADRGWQSMRPAGYDLRGEALIQAANDAWARLREDPIAWQEELEARRNLEGTLADGLEDE